VEGHPIHRVKGRKVKPMFNNGPNPSSVVVMNKEMRRRFGNPIAKREICAK
jgi:hypothetical protein